MTVHNLRERVHKQIDRLPDEFVEQIADFVSFLIARRKISQDYADWRIEDWQEFVLDQFFQDDDEVEYSINDAKEIYRP